MSASCFPFHSLLFSGKTLSVLQKISFAVLLMGVCLPLAFSQKTVLSARNKGVAKEYVELPLRSNDCFYAIEIHAGLPFGPTKPLQGFGFVKEGEKDLRNPHLLNEERNSVWYKLRAPYSGKMYLTITPLSNMDNYDFSVYKYTDKYFCNRVHRNGVAALRVNKVLPTPENKGITGLSLKATKSFIDSDSKEAFSSFIDVKKDEIYYFLISNDNDQGLGHTITVEIDTKFIPVVMIPSDSASKKRITVDYTIKETETGRTLMSNTNKGLQRANLVPLYSYHLTVKKEGYFDYNYAFSSTDFAKDSILSIRMVPIKSGLMLPTQGEIYFEDDYTKVLPESHAVLGDLIQTMKKYPSMVIEIIGNVNSQGFEPEKDLKISQLRADAIRNYLLSKGIADSRVKARGLTARELEEGIKQGFKKNVKQYYSNYKVKILEYRPPKLVKK